MWNVECGRIPVKNCLSVFQRRYILVNAKLKTNIVVFTIYSAISTSGMQGNPEQLRRRQPYNFATWILTGFLLLFL